MRKIISVTDWNQDQLARERFRTVVEGYSVDRKHVSIQSLACDPSSIHAGFLAYQMALTEAKNGDPTDTLIYIDTDPINEIYPVDTTLRSNCFAVVRLTNNILVCGNLTGYNFAWLKPSVQQFMEYTDMTVSDSVSTHDVHARVVAHLADYLDDQLDLQSLHEADVMTLPEDRHFICHRNHRTLISMLTQADLNKYELGDQIHVHIGGESLSAHFATSEKQPSDADLVAYIGHHGSPDNRYMELSVRSANMKKRIRAVKPGDTITLI